MAAASWADVRAALVAAGVTQTYAAGLGAGGTATAEAGAQALAALAATLQTDKGRAALAALALTGDAEVVRAALRTMGAGAKVVAGLPGREVEGTGFTYYEADTRAVRELLGEKEAAGGGVSVEVRNGSGAVDVAERAVVAIRPLGFSLLPIKNADDFPDVQITQVLAGPASLEDADRVRSAIGAGKVIKQDSLPPGQVVVIVGSDLTLDVHREGGGDEHHHDDRASRRALDDDRDELTCRRRRRRAAQSRYHRQMLYERLGRGRAAAPERGSGRGGRLRRPRVDDRHASGAVGGGPGARRRPRLPRAEQPASADAATPRPMSPPAPPRRRPRPHHLREMNSEVRVEGVVADVNPFSILAFGEGSGSAGRRHRQLRHPLPRERLRRVSGASPGCTAG